MFEDLKKSQRGGLSPKGPSARWFVLPYIRDPKARVVVMVVLLVGVVGGMLWINQWASSGEAQRTGGEQVPAPAPVDVRFSGIPTFDQQLADRVTDVGPDARRRWEPDAISYLMLEVRNTPAVGAYKRNLLPITSGSATEIDKNSRPWRFKYVRFRGPLEYIREENYDEVYGPTTPPQGQIQRGRVRVGDGEDAVHVVFLTPTTPMWRDTNGPEPRPPHRMIEDGWVRGRGILVKNYVDATGGQEVPALLVIATLVERDYAPVPVTTLQEIPFQIIHDDPAIAAEEDGRLILAKDYPRTLFRLVRYAEARAGPDGEALRKKEKLEPDTFDTQGKFEELIGQPARFRAKYYGGLGIIAVAPLFSGPTTITANDAGVEECINGWIVTDRNRLVQFVAPAALAGDWPKARRVYFEGYFYKTKLYPSVGKGDRLAPLLVLTVLNAVPPPPKRYVAQIAIAAGFILGIALLVFIIVREDKTKSDYRRLRRRRIPAQ